MKIACVGGGPAGLYLAILMKQSSSDHEVTVLERTPVGTPGGWGVVFWDDLLDDLHATDAETARRIRNGAVQWRGQLLDFEGSVVEHEGSGYGIGRTTLRDILVERATELGVEVRFDQAVSSAAAWPDADVVVAADGANSMLRHSGSDGFGTSAVSGRNKYLWLGTSKPFDLFTFAFVNTPAGWVWCHAYSFSENMSTFIVECAPDTWAKLGLDTLPARYGLRVLEEVFAKQLGGAPLESLGRDDEALPWLSFRSITNECWHSGNTVLVGDAAHTTHFSIGSGTRLAMQDAIALAAELQRSATPQAAFAAYESTRRAAILRPQAEARFSAQWFESVARYVDLPAPAFFTLLRARRDPLLPRVSPKLYAAIYAAVDRVGFMRALRGSIGPKVRAFHSRHAATAAR
jgi:2-polyprenyl-6-methoxyphenol hydroxylase-like FAD-dependent oxidoreductase